MEKSGEAFLSNALIGGKFVLRACIVNFHTSLGDIQALPRWNVAAGEDGRFFAGLRREPAESSLRSGPSVTGRHAVRDDDRVDVATCFWP